MRHIRALFFFRNFRRRIAVNSSSAVCLPLIESKLDSQAFKNIYIVFGILNILANQQYMPVFTKWNERMQKNKLYRLSVYIYLLSEYLQNKKIHQ